MAKLIAANWKMNKTLQETKEFINALKKIKISKDRQVLICPAFTSLYTASKLLKNTKILLGAQNMHFEDKGAFTGEISGIMLKDIGCSHVIIGHSERRHKFNEQDELINKKVKKALSLGITPILCVGELLEERNSGKGESVISRQLVNGLQGVTESDIVKVIIAYEPVWAISGQDPTHEAATPQDAKDMHVFIKKKLVEMYSAAASEMRIIYGGSMKPENAHSLLAIQEIDGGLVGGASLDIKKFSVLIS